MAAIGAAPGRRCVGGWAVQQLWLFWVAPMLGAAAAGFTYKTLLEGPVEAPPVTGRPETT